jgi:DNA ligase (NAD+)
LNIKYYTSPPAPLLWEERGELFWKKVCITWSFEQNWTKISRDELIKKLEEVWWNFISLVSKKTDFLLAWEKAGSKLEKAKKLGVKILNLTGFKKEL